MNISLEHLKQIIESHLAAGTECLLHYRPYDRGTGEERVLSVSFRQDKSLAPCLWLRGLGDTDDEHTLVVPPSDTITVKATHVALFAAGESQPIATIRFVRNVSPVGAVPIALPDPPAEIHLPQVLTLQDVHDLLCEHSYAECGGEPIWEFELQWHAGDDEDLESPYCLSLELLNHELYSITGNPTRYGDTIRCCVSFSEEMQIDLTPNPTAQ